MEFDREAGLHSLPARLGPAAALRASALLHGVTVIALAALIPVADLGWIYGAGVGAIAALLIYEHILIKPDDLRRLNTAFFRVNAIVSLLVLMSVTADLLL